VTRLSPQSVKSKLQALVYSWLIAMVVLSAAEGSMGLCLHFADHEPAQDACNGQDACHLADTDSECHHGESQHCVDLQIEGLDLDFHRDYSEVAAPEVAISSPVVVEPMLASLRNKLTGAHSPRGPPEPGRRVHVSVPTTVLRI